MKARGGVVDNLVAVYKALGGGWQLRRGNNYVDEDIRTRMAERTNWGEYLDSDELPRQGDVEQ